MGFFQLLQVLHFIAVGSGASPNTNCAKRRIDKSGDPTRALLFMLIVLTVILDFAQSEKVECPTSPSPPECAFDCNGNIWFHDRDKGSCQQCPKCGRGQGLDSHCGGKDGQQAKCETCIPGVTFTDRNDYWCRPCRLCDNTVDDAPCNITTDTVCGKCRTGYYHEKGKPDQCHPCEFLSQPELEPQCQIPQNPTTDPPQEGSKEAKTTDTMLAPTLSDENTSPPQETNYVSPSPSSGDLVDQVVPSTDILSPGEEAGKSPGSADLAEDEQEVDEAVPSSSNHNAILGICVTVLIILVVTLMYKCLKKRFLHRATCQHCPQINYVEVNAKDSEDVAIDVNAQTVSFRVNQHETLAGEPSGNRGGLSHFRSADSVGRSSTNLLGSTRYSDPHLSRHLTFNAIMPDDDERDEMITTPINTAAHSSTSCSGPENSSDDIKATSFEVLPKMPDFQLGGEPLFLPAKQESSSGKNIISPGSLPGRASDVGTQHPTTERWNMGLDSRRSMVTSAYLDGNRRVADPVADPVTLCKENEIDIDKVSTCKAASTLGVTDVAVSFAAVVVDGTSASLRPSLSPADTHADAALATTDSSAAAATVAGAVSAIFPDETDGAAYLTEIEDSPNPASGLTNKDTGARPESNCSSPLNKSTTSKKSRRSKVRVAPSDLDSSNGSKEHSARSLCGHYIIASGKSKVYIVGDNSKLKIGYDSTDTAESDE